MSEIGVSPIFFPLLFFLCPFFLLFRSGLFRAVSGSDIHFFTQPRPHSPAVFNFFRHNPAQGKQRGYREQQQQHQHTAASALLNSPYAPQGIYRSGDTGEQWCARSASLACPSSCTRAYYLLDCAVRCCLTNQEPYFWTFDLLRERNWQQEQQQQPAAAWLCWGPSAMMAGGCPR